MSSWGRAVVRSCQTLSCLAGVFLSLYCAWESTGLGCRLPEWGDLAERRCKWPFALAGLLIAVKATCLPDYREKWDGRRQGSALADEGDGYVCTCFRVEFPSCQTGMCHLAWGPQVGRYLVSSPGEGSVLSVVVAPASPGPGSFSLKQ